MPKRHNGKIFPKATYNNKKAIKSNTVWKYPILTSKYNVCPCKDCIFAPTNTNYDMVNSNLKI